MSPSLAPLSVDRTLQTGWQLFTRSFIACVPLALLGVCAGGAPQAFALATGHAQDLQWGLVYVASNAIMLICYGAVILRQHELLTGGDAALVPSLRRSLACLPATVLSTLLVLAPLLAVLAVLWAVGLLSLTELALGVPATLLGGLLFLLGLLALTVATTYLMFTWPVLLVERPGPAAALVRSARLVRGNFWRLSGLFGIAAAGVLVFVIIAGVFAGVIMLVSQAGAGSDLAGSDAAGLRSNALATVLLPLLLVCPVLYLCSLGVAAYASLRARHAEPIAADHQQG